MRRTQGIAQVASAMLMLLMLSCSAGSAELKILLPLGRVAYQTNERIAVTILRGSPDGLMEGDLALKLVGEDGSTLSFAFPIGRVEGEPATATEHLQVSGALLRPGRYTIEAACDGASAQSKIEVYSHVRRSSFKLIDWASRAQGREQAVLGEDSVGFNLLYAAYGGLDPDESIRGGLDFMWNCTMSGGAQVDLRGECDWSDPCVLGGGVARLSQRAFRDRTRPNCIGVHIFDEPCLIRHKHPATGESTHFNVPVQDRSFQATFDRDPIQYSAVRPGNADDLARWFELNHWRLTLLDAAWKLCREAVTDVRPDWLSANQGSWLFSGFGAGYYFNYQRSLPVYSGHGGYDYIYGGHFVPGFFHEFGRMRQADKPQWYLPVWNAQRDDLFRAEQYLSFQMHLAGMAVPPDARLHTPSQTVATGIVESNRAMARLGTIFTTMPVTRPPVAVLFSLSHALENCTRDMKDTYYGGGQWHKLLAVYMAMKQIHVPIFPVVEEDIADGTLAAHHKAVILAGTNYLPARTLAALERFIAGGGAVLVSDDSRVDVKGAVRYAMPPDFLELGRKWDVWASKQQWDPWNEAVVTSAAFKLARPLAKILEEKLDALGIRPAFGCDQEGISASRQAAGDIEYLFAVNASPDFRTLSWYCMRTVEARISLPEDGRPVYDAMRGGELGAFRRSGRDLAAKLRFGPGQMRVFARTARPVGAVQVLTPVVRRNLTEPDMPIRLDVTALLADTAGHTLSGSAPFRLQVIDPLGATRYDLYRATAEGVLQLSLPLAANDPAGQWTIVARELLSNREGRATFPYAPPPECGSAAGATRRAIAVGRDRENVFRFFRRHHDVTIVKGSVPFHEAQAQRLARILEPWDIHCRVVPATEVNKPRELTEEQAKTWVGLDFGRAKPGRGNSPAKAGFDLRGPAILLGTPQDNPLIGFLDQQGFLPYKPDPAAMPGPRRGYIAWQRDGIGYFGQESLALIAYDEAGMAEAVGTVYECMVGLEPLTPLALPSTSSVVTATAVPERVPAPVERWEIRLPDRPVAMKKLSDDEVLILTDDGTLSLLRANGRLRWQKAFDGGERWALDASPEGNRIALGTSHRLIALDRRGRELFSTGFSPSKYPAWIACVAVSPDSKRIAVAGGINHWAGKWHWRGKLLMLSPTGQRLWEQGDTDPASGAPTSPDAFQGAIFSADGRRLVLLAAKNAQIIETETGKPLANVEGPAGAVQPRRVGEQLLVVEGGDKLSTLSPDQGQVVARLDLPVKSRIVTCEPVGDGVVIGTESDGAIRWLKARAGKAEEHLAWADAVRIRIVRKLVVQGSRVATAYWGGALRILGPRGKVVCAKSFDQDISDMVWLGHRLVVALADGRVIALDAPEH